MSKQNKHSGSTLDDFLMGEDVYEDCVIEGLKRALAWQLQEIMDKQGITKSRMAKNMNTSRASLDRLLDPGNESVTLRTIQKAARVTGQKLEMRFVPSSEHVSVTA